MDGQESVITEQRLSALRQGMPVRGRFAIGIVVAALVIGAMLAVRSVNAPAVVPATDPPLPIVSISVPGTEPVVRAVTFTGTIAARHDISIGSDGETGRIAAVLVDVGDRVEQGQVLARLDASTLRPEVERLGAALEQARAEAELAEAEYGRAAGVFSSAGALSKEEVERRRSSSVTAAARVKVAAAQLAEGQARLARTEIRAPAAGIVLARAAEVGQIAGPGNGVLFRLAEGGEVELRGQISEQDMPHLRIGQPATARLTGIDSAFEGSVRLLGAMIDPETRLGEVRVALKSDPNLRPGAFARGEVMVGTEPRPVVPQTAVLSDAQGTYVVIVGPDDRVARRAVKVGGTTAHGVAIVEGLKGDERVVTTAGAFLREGERVAVAKTEGAAPKS